MVSFAFYLIPKGDGDRSCNLIGSWHGLDFPVPTVTVPVMASFTKLVVVCE